MTRVHHYGYALPDLEQAIHNSIVMYGIGPFLMIENVPLENVTSRGEPAIFSHSTAFAQWGDIRIELSQIHQCEPARVRDAFASAGIGVNRVAWTVSSLEAAGERLECVGAPSFVNATSGDISFVFHDSRATAGHHIELACRYPCLPRLLRTNPRHEYRLERTRSDSITLVLRRPRPLDRDPTSHFVITERVMPS